MIIKADEFDFNILSQIGVIHRNKRKKGSKDYLNIVTAFDIETTRLSDIEQSVMYIWQYQFGNDLTIIGRNWSEWFKLLEGIAEYIKDIIDAFNPKFSIFKNILVNIPKNKAKP